MSHLDLLEHPYIQESLQQKKPRNLEKEVTLPFVMKDKILMSPGVWNNHFYTVESVKRAFENTDWNDKEITSLFLDHEDRNAREWVGQVSNVRMEGEDVVGDLEIVEKPTAMKLAFGAKMGISPKVTGEEENGTMLDFLFDNFSVVINPAVKRAYINNSELAEAKMSKEEIENQKKKLPEGLDPEADVRNRGDVVFDARDPKINDFEDHFPINDADQARNALARVAQFDGSPEWYDGSLDELIERVRKAVAEKFPSIDVTGLREKGKMANPEMLDRVMEKIRAGEQLTPEEESIVASAIDAIKGEDLSGHGEHEPKKEEDKMSEHKQEEQTSAPKESELSEFSVFAEKYMAENEGVSISDAMSAFNEYKQDPVLARINALEKQNKDLMGMVQNLSEKLESKPEPETQENSEESQSEESQESQESEEPKEEAPSEEEKEELSEEESDSEKTTQTMAEEHVLDEPKKETSYFLSDKSEASSADRAMWNYLVEHS